MWQFKAQQTTKAGDSHTLLKGRPWKLQNCPRDCENMQGLATQLRDRCPHLDAGASRGTLALTDGPEDGSRRRVEVTRELTEMADTDLP